VIGAQGVDVATLWFLFGDARERFTPVDTTVFSVTLPAYSVSVLVPQ